MGLIRPRTIMEFSRLLTDVGIECEDCSRTAVFTAAGLSMWMTARGYKTSLPLVEHPFVCRCGCRQIKVVAVAMCQRPDPLPQPSPPLVPMYVIPASRRSKR